MAGAIAKAEACQHHMYHMQATAGMLAAAWTRDTRGNTLADLSTHHPHLQKTNDAKPPMPRS